MSLIRPGAIMGPFPLTLRMSQFTDAAGAGVTTTSTYVPLSYFRVPLKQAYRFLPSTQYSVQQHYWSQGITTLASGTPAVASGTGLRLERRDASGQYILDTIDIGTAGDIPTIATTSKVSLRYFQHMSVVSQDEYIYLSVQSTSGQTVNNSITTNDLLVKGEYFIQG